MMKSNLNLFKFLILVLFLGACSNDDDAMETMENDIRIAIISGAPDSGQELTAFYEVSGFTPLDYDTATTVIKWWRADDNLGTNATMIAGEMTRTYTLTGSDVGKFIAFEAAVENTTNLTLLSDYIGPVTVSATGALAKEIDTQLFSQIKAVDNVLTTQSLWSDYNLTNTPMYLIHKNNNGIIDRGFVVNPLSTISGATAVPSGENGGLNVVRYDMQAQEAFDLIENMGNGLYTFNFNINGDSIFYTQIYTDTEVLAGEQLAQYPGGFFSPADVTFGSIDFIVHEPFHDFQDSWSFTGSSTFPTFSQDFLELRALTHQIFKDFPNGAQDSTTLENKLRQFVAIRSAENILLGFDSASESEKLEGTARYVEKLALRNVFPNRATEPFIPGSITDDDYGITNQVILEAVIENLQYELGASVYVALEELVPNVQFDIEAGANQFTVARDYFNMTQTELDQQLQNAKNSVNFSNIQAKASEWMNL
ncbi:hypothetical protein [uncultured Algibacter sp.]|uniref:hypothetical protein n=1 Tax=uncultured Algibacter sp. TaxID=298659 RepID=UPI0032163673